MNTSPLDHSKTSTVIVGAGGRLGSALLNRYSTSRNVVGLKRSDLDLSDLQSIRRMLEPLVFDRLILPGALTAVDYCEDHEDEAFAVNADGPKLIAEICAEKGAHVTFISTDFVFDGLSDYPYDEKAIARPLSVYGASKLEGEENVLNASKDNLVVRVSWLYGAGKPAFPEWIIQQAMTKCELALPDEKKGVPTFVGDIVEYLWALNESDPGNPASGIFHLANSGQCTWREWGQFCIDNAALGGAALKVRKVLGNCLEDIASFKAQRPINSVLNTEKFSRATGITPRSWQSALLEHLLGSVKNN